MLLLLTMNISSCVEKGCTDPEAINFNPDAQRDDESCYYGDKNEDLKKSILRNHANLAHALYSDAHAEAISLATAVESFTESPSDDGFSKCRLAWKLAYNKYLKCDALRFSEGPIDNSKNLDRLIGAWPINERLIDYVGQSENGIINNPTILNEITASGLEAKNEALGKDEVTTGFHVIEFLLWGSDTGDASALTTGVRTFDDYLLNDSTILNADRRQDYVTSSANLLVSHLSTLSIQWDSLGVNNYRQTFLSLEPDDALKLILTGLGTLTRGELADRALQNPLEKSDPALEISNFSDNTVTDIISMKRSMELVYYGEYESETTLPVKGASLEDLLTTLNPDRAKHVTETFDLLTETMVKIPSPFDIQVGFEAANGPGPITKAVDVLLVLEDHWYEVARDIGFGISTDLPE